MKLYVCYGTFLPAPRPGLEHPCGHAHKALREAGYEPEVIRSYGLGPLGPLNVTAGRREVKRLTGNWWVPALVADDGEVVQGRDRIEAWARANPAPVPASG